MLKRLRGKSGERGLRMFFASDIHGSDRCWKKFLAAANTYDASVLVMGGDILAKAVVPIVERSGEYVATLGGGEERFQTRADAARFETHLRDQGYYTTILRGDDTDALASPAAVDELFERLALESITRWLELASDRLDGKGVTCLLMPGNDDIWEIDPLIAESDVVVNPAGQRVRIGGDEGYDLLGLDHANPTPWHTPREFAEEELAEVLEALYAGVEDEERVVLVTHVPPFDSGLDGAPRLRRDADEVVLHSQMGAVDMVPVGSKAVRDIIERRQPLLTLHGHIHEARAKVKIGRAVCVNPGSEYSSGDISGAVVELRGSTVHQCQLVIG